MRAPSRRVLATALFGVVVAEFAVLLVEWLATGLGFAVARDTFLISNATIGGASAVCGFLIARQRPDHRIGWLMLAVGIAQTTTAAVTPAFVHAVLTSGGPADHARTWSTTYSLAWPWSPALLLPLALLHFPDGRLTGRPARIAAAALALNAPLQMLLFSADPNPLNTAPELAIAADGRAASWLRIPALVSTPWLGMLSDAVLALAYGTALLLLGQRYRRGDSRARQQLLWLLLAVFLAVVAVAFERFPGTLAHGGLPILSTLALGLIPIAITIAVVRYQLLDIRMVWSRTLTYLLLSAAVAVSYIALVRLGAQLLQQQAGLGTSVLAALVVAVAFGPVRVRLQRAVNRLLYGERGDPVRAAAAVTASLAEGARRPVDVLPAVCDALRLPYAALVDGDRLLGEHGRRPEHVEAVPLLLAGDRVGELRVGARSGERTMARADRAVLELVAVPIGVALRASRLADDVQDSRRAIVTAREEERRRLRHELHDGLGPVLTGIAFQADAVVNLADRDPGEVRRLGEDMRSSVAATIEDVRQLIYELRPVALDELGLVEALRRHAARLDGRNGSSLSVVVTAPPALPRLPAAVEVAAYRIATEALTNVVRHAGASTAEVRIDLDESSALRVVVQDDGARVANGSRWRPGEGLASMRERAVELGGSFAAEPTAAGGRVSARFPLPGAP